MKLIHALLTIIVLAGIAASLALAGTAQKTDKSAQACCADEACCDKAAGCKTDQCCDAEGGCKSETCGDCGDTAASCHGAAPAPKPATKSCCAG